MDEYKELWRSAVKVDLGHPETLVPGACILVGIVKTLKAIATKGGKMAFTTIADYNGEIEMTFFPKAWENCQDKIAEDEIAVVRGKIEYQEDKDRHSFIAEECVAPEDVEALLEKEESLARQMDEYRAVWKGEVKLNIARPETADSQDEYVLVGLIKDLRPFQTKNGNDMAYATLVDYNGEIGVTIFPKTWTELQDKLEENGMAALRGKIKKDNYKNRYAFYPDTMLSLKRLKSKYDKMPPVDEAPPSAAPLDANNGGNNHAVHIMLRQEALEKDEDIYPLRDYLTENSGSCAVFIHIPVGGGERIIRTATGIGAFSEGESPGGLDKCAAVARVWRE
jgi:DNA polymerase-3 subunit alpha